MSRRSARSFNRSKNAHPGSIERQVDELTTHIIFKQNENAKLKRRNQGRLAEFQKMTSYNQDLGNEVANLDDNYYLIENEMGEKAELLDELNSKMELMEKEMRQYRAILLANKEFADDAHYLRKVQKKRNKLITQVKEIEILMNNNETSNNSLQEMKDQIKLAKLHNQAIQEQIDLLTYLSDKSVDQETKKNKVDQLVTECDEKIQAINEQIQEQTEINMKKRAIKSRSTSHSRFSGSSAFADDEANESSALFSSSQLTEVKISGLESESSSTKKKKRSSKDKDNKGELEAENTKKDEKESKDEGKSEKEHKSDSKKESSDEKHDSTNEPKGDKHQSESYKIALEIGEGVENTEDKNIDNEDLKSGESKKEEEKPIGMNEIPELSENSSSDTSKQEDNKTDEVSTKAEEENDKNSSSKTEEEKIAKDDKENNISSKEEEEEKKDKKDKSSSSSSSSSSSESKENEKKDEEIKEEEKTHSQDDSVKSELSDKPENIPQLGEDVVTENKKRKKKKHKKAEGNEEEEEKKKKIVIVKKIKKVKKPHQDVPLDIGVSDDVDDYIRRREEEWQRELARIQKIKEQHRINEEKLAKAKEIYQNKVKERDQLKAVMKDNPLFILKKCNEEDSQSQYSQTDITNEKYNRKEAKLQQKRDRMSQVDVLAEKVKKMQDEAAEIDEQLENNKKDSESKEKKLREIKDEYEILKAEQEINEKSSILQKNAYAAEAPIRAEIRAKQVELDRLIKHRKSAEERYKELLRQRAVFERDLDDMYHREKPEIKRLMSEVGEYRQKVQEGKNSLERTQNILAQKQEELENERVSDIVNRCNDMTVQKFKLERSQNKWRFLITDTKETLQHIEAYSTLNYPNRKRMSEQLEKLEREKIRRDNEFRQMDEYSLLCSKLLMEHQTNWSK